jgi:hypothetical protein
MPPPVDPKLKKKEQDELKKVVLKRFGAAPRTVSTFGTTAVSWETTVPESAFDIFINLNDEVVPAAGNKNFTLTRTRTFTLTASTPNAGRKLRSVTVTVDASDCRSKLILNDFVITQVLKSELNKRFSGSDKVILRDDKTGVILKDNTILIGVPLELKVPDFFNADMDISIDLAVSGFSVKARSVSVSVDWSFFEGLTTLGCSKFVESGMEKMAQTFLESIVETQLAPGIAERIAAESNSFVQSLQDSDPAKRTFAATLVSLSAQGITATACPK